MITFVNFPTPEQREAFNTSRKTFSSATVRTLQTLSIPIKYIARNAVGQTTLNFPADEATTTLNSEGVEPFYHETSNFLFLDVVVHDRENKENIAKILKVYEHSMLESKKFDNSRFNFRAWIKTEPLTRKQQKRAVNYLNSLIKRSGYSGYFDIGTTRRAMSAFHHDFKFWTADDGGILTLREINENEDKTLIRYTPEIRQAVFDVFEQQGYGPTSRLDIDHVKFVHFDTKDDSYNWYSTSPFKLWHFDHEKNVDIYQLFTNQHKLSDFTEKATLKEILSKRVSKNDVKPYMFNTPFLHGHDVQKHMVEWRDQGGVLCMKSAMGTGKTEIIKRALQMFQEVIVVTPRLNLAYELAYRCELPTYGSGDLNQHASLCVQYDSLFKLDVKKFKCIIIDEVMTLENHIGSSFNQKFTPQNINKLNALLQNSKHVMILDALMHENIQDMFRHKKIWWCENTYKDSTPVVVHKTEASFLKELAGTTHRRVSVSCVELARLESLKKYMEDAGHSVISISSLETPTERKRLLQQFKEGKHSALLYTPAISVGVSIECDVDKHFHYDTARVVNAVQSIQMMKRSRAVEQIDCFIGERTKVSTLSYDEIQRRLMLDQPSLNNFTAGGDQVLSQPGKLYALFTLHKNIWNWDYKESFKYLAKQNFNRVHDQDLKVPNKYKGSIIKKSKHKTDWTPEIQNTILNALGDEVNKFIEKIKPSDVPDFLEYYNFRMSAESPAWKAQAQQKASASANFGFRRLLKEYEKIQHQKSIKAKHVQLPERQMNKFGFVLEKSLLGSKYERRKDFDELFSYIMEREF